MNVKRIFQNISKKVLNKKILKANVVFKYWEMTKFVLKMKKIGRSPLLLLPLPFFKYLSQILKFWHQTKAKIIRIVSTFKKNLH